MKERLSRFVTGLLSIGFSPELGGCNYILALFVKLDGLSYEEQIKFLKQSNKDLFGSDKNIVRSIEYSIDAAFKSDKLKELNNILGYEAITNYKPTVRQLLFYLHLYFYFFI